MTDAPGMSRWRKRLFALSHNAANPIDYFGLPPERTITMGSQVPLWAKPECSTPAPTSTT